MASLGQPGGGLGLGDLVDPALVPATRERRVQPELDNFIGQAEGDDPSAHGQHVRIVVFAGQPRREQVVAERRTDTSGEAHG